MERGKYDNVLLKKLFCYGFCGTCLDWFQSFLGSRFIQYNTMHYIWKCAIFIPWWGQVFCSSGICSVPIEYKMLYQLWRFFCNLCVFLHFLFMTQLSFKAQIIQWELENQLKYIIA